MISLAIGALGAPATSVWMGATSGPFRPDLAGLDFNGLDWFLIALALMYALSGYWQGFIAGAFATIGLLVGGAIGIWLAPIALGDAAPSLMVSLGALFIVILSASLGQASLQYAGAQLRERIRWQPVRALDAVGGAALSATAVLFVAWTLGVAVSGTRIGFITPMVQHSTVLAQVDRLLPDEADRAFNAFNNVVGTTFFPRYLEPFAPERIVAVPAGPSRMTTDPDVTARSSSVLKVYGTNSCGRGLEGSGFVYAPNRLMTNAHVVAGVRNPEVLIGEDRHPAKVVYYNPELDVAVLDFASQGLTPLSFRTDPSAREGVAILGYPHDGPFDIQSGRIRAEQRLRSPDIYGQGTVIREVLSLRGAIRPGNSGGPVLDSAGKVVGVVFAASVTDTETGYALTSSAVAESAARGIASSGAVPTGNCA